MSDSFALRDDLIGFAVIVERDFDFAAIIAVDNPDFICGGKSAFARQTASRVDEPYVAERYFDRDVVERAEGLVKKYGVRLIDVPALRRPNEAPPIA